MTQSDYHPQDPRDPFEFQRDSLNAWDRFDKWERLYSGNAIEARQRRSDHIADIIAGLILGLPLGMLIIWWLR